MDPSHWGQVQSGRGVRVPFSAGSASSNRLEYDFVVAGGADPRAIKLDISGAKGEKVDNRGDLVLDMGRTGLSSAKFIRS
jgi:hypothetical protein